MSFAFCGAGGGAGARAVGAGGGVGVGVGIWAMAGVAAHDPRQQPCDNDAAPHAFNLPQVELAIQRPIASTSAVLPASTSMTIHQQASTSRRTR